MRGVVRLFRAKLIWTRELFAPGPPAGSGSPPSYHDFASAPRWRHDRQGYLGRAEEYARHRGNRRQRASSPKERYDRGLVGGDRIEITVALARPPGRRRIKSTILSSVGHRPERAQSTGASASFSHSAAFSLRTARDSRSAVLCQLQTMGGVADVALSVID